MSFFSHIYLLSALGFHKNIVRYYSSWIEDEQMYTQMEFCDHNLSSENCSTLLTERHEMDVLYQVSLILYVLL